MVSYVFDPLLLQVVGASSEFICIKDFVSNSLPMKLAALLLSPWWSIPDSVTLETLLSLL